MIIKKTSNRHKWSLYKYELGLFRAMFKDYLIDNLRLTINPSAE